MTRTGSLMRAGVLALTLAATAGSAQAVVVHVSDFIPDGSRTNFNGFESIPNDGTFFTGGSGPYVEGGIQVQQINGDAGNDIWVTYLSWGAEGAHAWYPNSGDHGYTRVTMADDSEFGSVGFLRGSGGSPTLLLYELYNDGAFLTGGSVAHGLVATYLGFSGGGFDEIIMRDNHGGGSAVTDGSFQALAIDSIEVDSGRPGPTVPGPASIFLLVAGLAGMGWVGRRQA